jgi:hypothetical protein
MYVKSVMLLSIVTLVMRSLASVPLLSSNLHINLRLHVHTAEHPFFFHVCKKSFIEQGDF